MRIALCPTAIAILSAFGVLAQSPVTPEKAVAARQALEPHDGEREFRCTIEPIRPVLRYTDPEVAAGFTYSIPVVQLGESRQVHGWSVVAEFTSNASGDAKTYLNEHIDAAGLNRDFVSGSSTYWMGLGSYSVRLAISDDMQGKCREATTVTVGGWRRL